MKVLPVKLTSEQKELLRQAAASRGVGMAELMRLATAHYLGMQPEAFSLVRGKYPRQPGTDKAKSDNP